MVAAVDTIVPGVAPEGGATAASAGGGPAGVGIDFAALLALLLGGGVEAAATTDGEKQAAGKGDDDTADGEGTPSGDGNVVAASTGAAAVALAACAPAATVQATATAVDDGSSADGAAVGTLPGATTDVPGAAAKAVASSASAPTAGPQIGNVPVDPAGSTSDAAVSAATTASTPAAALPDDGTAPQTASSDSAPATPTTDAPAASASDTASADASTQPDATPAPAPTTGEALVDAASTDDDATVTAAAPRTATASPTPATNGTQFAQATVTAAATPAVVPAATTPNDGPRPGEAAIAPREIAAATVVASRHGQDAGETADDFTPGQDDGTPGEHRHVGELRTHGHDQHGFERSQGPAASDGPGGLTPPASSRVEGATEATVPARTPTPGLRDAESLLAGASLRPSRLPDGGEMRLEVTREGLGQVEVHVSVRHDSVHAALFAEQDQTREALATQRPALEAALGRQQLRLEGFTVGMGQHQQRGEYPPHPGQSAPVPTGAGPREMSSVTPSATTSEPACRPGGGLSLRA